ncbi:hypothetical protein [Nonlabens ulvanivorans]|uniref:Haem-binding uptake Tiki superfamily ChaN domain-containing protein n=1 Tax=Nonlabens ulvanivorans TaxID=906888 RepID=A0A084JZT2_NONUL|nr:hypothetical protein [Nonlabens ulvanivorans]KEZ94466.1 hypothetical protein IL45_00875 [Nonlabens ulvanivorans]PRX13499.1 hypothetical protein LY02_01742 [Nonlabens ulvanivorans]
MSTLIILGTAHSEVGVCTSEELYKIIEKINPQVVFCEISPEKLSRFVKRTDIVTPEMEVIKRLIKEKPIEIVPIDVNEDPFDKRLEAMFSLINRKMKVYSNANNKLLNETYVKGLPFLNSPDSDKIFRDKNSMEKHFIDKVNNQELSDFYSEWLRWNDLRENQWINLIDNNFKINKPNKAVFLVGAGHRFRLLDKIKKIHNNSENSYDWDFFPYK